MSNIAIFGGQGYIGKNLISQLQDEHSIIAIDRRVEKVFPELKYENLSSQSADFITTLNNFSPDYFIVSYYGNPAIRDNDVYIDLVANFRNIYTKLEKKPVIVFFSSQLVYGNSKEPLKKETDHIQPIDKYAQMCALMENFLLSEVDGNYVILRVPIVYGNSVDVKSYQNVVFKFIDQAKKGNNLTVFGNGSQMRSVVHVEDFAMLLNMVITAGRKGLILNASFGEYISIKDIADCIVQKYGVQLDVSEEWPAGFSANESVDILLDGTQALVFMEPKWSLLKYLAAE